MNNKILNFRDLGGIVNKNGKKVKSNVLFRSGNLNIGDEELANVLSSYEIKVIYDLRSKNEVESAPYRAPKNVTYKHYPVLSSLESHLKDVNLDLSNAKQAFALNDIGDFMANINKEMALNPIMFGEIIKDIISLKGEPVLFHCSAGKDRTGFLTALILLSLDVSYEVILDNYLLSNIYLKDSMNEQLAKISAYNLPEEKVAQIKDMLSVKKENLKHFYEVIKSYPSFADYAVKKLLLSLADLEMLKQLFLE